MYTFRIQGLYVLFLESFEDGSDQTKSELPGNLEGMLSPNNLDVEKMLTEGLAHMDGQTVEDIFKGVLQDGQEAPAKPPAGMWHSFVNLDLRSIFLSNQNLFNQVK